MSEKRDSNLSFHYPPRRRTDAGSPEDFAMLAPFDLPDMKIARARKHIQELEMELVTYFNAKPLRLVVELNPFNDQTRHQSHAWVPRISAEPGPILATIIGDVFHNLRATLDVLACDLVRIAQKSPKNVYFPFADSADAMPKRIKDKNLDRAGEEVVKIVTELKPYPSGDKFLRAIHDMDVLDKHQALVPVVAGGASPQATIAFGPQPTNLMPIKTIIKDGRPLWIMPPVSNLPLGTELAAEWVVVFDHAAGPLAGGEIVEMLNYLASLTTRIVQLFRARFPGPYPSFDPSSP